MCLQELFHSHHVPGLPGRAAGLPQVHGHYNNLTAGPAPSCAHRTIWAIFWLLAGLPAQERAANNTNTTGSTGTEIVSSSLKMSKVSPGDRDQTVCDLHRDMLKILEPARSHMIGLLVPCVPCASLETSSTNLRMMGSPR